MKINYDGLWKLLIDNKMNKTDLIKGISISPNTLSKLSKDKLVSSEILLKVSQYFKVQISEIISIEYDEHE